MLNWHRRVSFVFLSCGAMVAARRGAVAVVAKPGVQLSKFVAFAWRATEGRCWNRALVILLSLGALVFLAANGAVVLGVTSNLLVFYFLTLGACGILYHRC